MKSHCFQIQKDGLLKELESFDFARAFQKGYDGDLWIDVTLEAEDDLRALLQQTAVSETIMKACLEEKRILRFHSGKKVVYMEYPVHSDWQDKFISYISIILIPGVLLTVHRRAIPGINRLTHELCEEPLTEGHKNPFLLSHMLLELCRENVNALLEIRSQADKIAEQLDDKPESVVTDDIISLRRQADYSSAALLDQMYCFTRLSLTESDIFSAKEQSAFFKETLERAKNSDMLIGRIERRIEMLLNQFHLVLQDKSNYRLQILTIVSAIFLPLTLLAGIYGMNFEYMPILKNHYGYPITMGAMSLIVVSMVVFFKVRKWF